MYYESDILVKKNLLMVRIMWAISVVFIIFSMISGVDKKSLLVIAPTLLIISFVCTFLIIRKLIKDKVMYFISVGLSIIHFLFVFIFHDLNGFLIGFIILMIVSLYQNYKPVLLSSVMVLLSVIYGYFSGGQKMYGSFYDPLGFAIVIAVIMVFTALMCIQIRFTERIRTGVINQREESEKSRARIENILSTLDSSIANLNNFSQNLVSNINTTDHISGEITTAFHEISSSVESQVTIISNINKEIVNENNDIITIAEESGSMQSLSSQNRSEVGEIEAHSEQLADEMSKVHISVSDTVLLMNKLKSEAENIESILQSVNTISQQVNMLALNAAIEAARAGEHGRGFAVVADEIRKLADESKKSNSHISIILNDISEKIVEASKQVNIIQNAAEAGSRSVDDMAQRLRVVNGNSSAISSKVRNIDSIIVKIKNSSSFILENMTDISRFTEETSASVEEVLSNAMIQNKRIEEIVQSFHLLEDLIVKLKELVNNR